MAHPVTLIPGDGTGPALVDALVPVIEATGAEIAWRAIQVGDRVTPEVVEACVASGTVLMAFWRGDRQRYLAPIVTLRKQLGVFANIRPVHSLPGVPHRFDGVDLLVIRETTEDVYAHLEHESVRGVFESLKVTTRAACERIARFGYETALAQGRERVTIVHKANIMKQSDGMFLRTALEVAGEYPALSVDDCIVDALCMKLTSFPHRFDTLLCGNLFGDIVADLCSGLVGGRANAPSVNHGTGATVFTVGHGAPAGSDAANPTSLLFSAVLMLRHLGEGDAADRLMNAASAALEAGTLPRALGGAVTAAVFLEAVRKAL